MPHNFAPFSLPINVAKVDFVGGGEASARNLSQKFERKNSLVILFKPLFYDFGSGSAIVHLARFGLVLFKYRNIFETVLY